MPHIGGEGGPFAEYLVVSSTTETNAALYRGCDGGVEPCAAPIRAFHTYKKATDFARKKAAEELGKRFYVTRYKIGFLGEAKVRSKKY